MTDDEIYERAAALCDRGRGAEALQILDQIKEEEGSRVGRAHYLKGVAYELNHDLEQAIQSYSKCLAKTPNDPDALNNRGAVQYRLGKLNEAEQDLVQATQFNPNDDLAWSNLGLAQQGLGKTDDAINSLKRAFSLRRDASHALNLGNMLTEKNDLEQAEQYINEAIKENGKLASAYLSRAIVRNRQGKKRDALTDLELAKRYDAGFSLQAAIGLVKKEIGNP
ncbi:MAG: tetratricopeptide repeat protein [Pirellulales bacterium]